jgi:hypothetical protein
MKKNGFDDNPDPNETDAHYDDTNTIAKGTGDGYSCGLKYGNGFGSGNYHVAEHGSGFAFDTDLAYQQQAITAWL